MAGVARPAPHGPRRASTDPEAPSGTAQQRIAAAALRRVLAAGGPRMVYQPQLCLSRLTVTGYEALARFPESPFAGTERWFAMARAVGAGPALEAAAIDRALATAGSRPPGTTLAVNLSPTLLTEAPGLLAQVLPDDLTGIEVELTEQADQPGSLGLIRAALDALRDRGATVAIDDVGIAHSGLRRVIELEPDRLKIDRHLVQGVSVRPAKTALVRTIVELAGQIGASVCAEGVETVEDLEALAELDVDSVQGWLIGGADSGFSRPRRIAVTAARESLEAMLAGRSSERDPQIGRITDAAELSRLIGTYCEPLGAELVVLSALSPEGTSLRAMPGLNVRDDPTTYRLADYPTTRRCLEEQVVVPVRVGRSGDTSEWQAMAEVGYPSALLVPVVSRGRAIALLECFRSSASTWSRREIRQARNLAELVGPALELLLTQPGHPLAGQPKRQPAQRSPAQRSPAQRNPAQRSPAQRNPAQRSPAQRNPAQRGPAQRLPAEARALPPTVPLPQVVTRAMTVGARVG